MPPPERGWGRQTLARRVWRGCSARGTGLARAFVQHPQGGDGDGGAVQPRGGGRWEKLSPQFARSPLAVPNEGEPLVSRWHGEMCLGGCGGCGCPALLQPGPALPQPSSPAFRGLRCASAVSCPPVQIHPGGAGGTGPWLLSVFADLSAPARLMHRSRLRRRCGYRRLRDSLDVPWGLALPPVSCKGSAGKNANLSPAPIPLLPPSG